MAAIGLLRITPALLSLILVLHPWRMLFPLWLFSPWRMLFTLWLHCPGLLSLFPHFRCTLLRRTVIPDRFLNAISTPLYRLRAWIRRSNLLVRS